MSKYLSYLDCDFISSSSALLKKERPFLLAMNGKKLCHSSTIQEQRNLKSTYFEQYKNEIFRLTSSLPIFLKFLKRLGAFSFPMTGILVYFSKKVYKFITQS